MGVSAVSSDLSNTGNCDEMERLVRLRNCAASAHPGAKCLPTPLDRASRERVKAFSFTGSCWHATSHSCCDTIGGVCIARCPFRRTAREACHADGAELNGPYRAEHQAPPGPEADGRTRDGWPSRMGFRNGMEDTCGNRPMSFLGNRRLWSGCRPGLCSQVNPDIQVAEIKAVAFDAFPVCDSRPIFRACEEAFPGRGSDLNNTTILPGGVTA